MIGECGCRGKCSEWRGFLVCSWVQAVQMPRAGSTSFCQPLKYDQVGSIHSWQQGKPLMLTPPGLIKMGDCLPDRLPQGSKKTRRVQSTPTMCDLFERVLIYKSVVCRSLWKGILRNECWLTWLNGRPTNHWLYIT